LAFKSYYWCYTGMEQHKNGRHKKVFLVDFVCL